MNKYLIFTLISFLSFASLQAQSAKELLDKVSKNYNDNATYYIKFEYTTQEGYGKAEKKTGELYASKSKFNVSIEDINQIFTGKQLYTVSKSDKEVTISNVTSNSDDILTPTKVLNMYKNGFKSELGKTQTIAGIKIQFITLTPNSGSDNNLRSVSVGINTKNNSIYQYKETSLDGLTISVTVKEYLENLIIPKTLFTFDTKKYKSKGYIITQL